MTDLRTKRLTLHPIDVAEGERITARQPGATDVWAPDFPADGDVVGCTAFLQATAAHCDQRPFGYYRITRAVDGMAVGGIGFKGPPVDGTIEIGYGLAPSARGRRYAAEAVTALVDLATVEGVSRVVADTEWGNIASRRTLERAGFRCVHGDDGLAHYELLASPIPEA